MIIIDNQGRIFGKINIIDFGCILFLLSFLPMIYWGYRIFTKIDPPPKPKTTIEIPISEYEGLKNKIRDYELSLNTLTIERDVADQERDATEKERSVLQDKINNFYKKEPKRAKRYF